MQTDGAGGTISQLMLFPWDSIQICRTCRQQVGHWGIGVGVPEQAEGGQVRRLTGADCTPSSRADLCVTPSEESRDTLATWRA